MSKRYLFTTIGGLFLATIVALFSISIHIVLCVFYNQVGIIPIILSFICCSFLSFGTFLCYWSSIKINFKTKKVIITTLKRKVIDIDKIVKINISTENSVDDKKYCNIVFLLNNNTTYTCSGFRSVFKFKDVEKTKKLVKAINKDLNLEV